MHGTEALIKWPGGKSREIRYIRDMIPSFDRYIEPFFGGGAMFFHLRPEAAAINDLSEDLMAFYTLVKAQDPAFQAYLTAYARLFGTLLDACGRHGEALAVLFLCAKAGGMTAAALSEPVARLAEALLRELPVGDLALLVRDREGFLRSLTENGADKLVRTVKNNSKKPFSEEDLRENLVTGFASGFYMYFRGVYNDLHRESADGGDTAYRIANFYFIREYCYGSMFRYNRQGEFNIPYGGMSYNRKDFGAKVRSIFSGDTAALFRGTETYCLDFEMFLDEVAPTAADFLFLDPPYDTDFSDYEGMAFTREDHRRLADCLKRTSAQFILIIQNNDYIHSLYADRFNILTFDKTYSYNVRSRNDRSAEHLIVTNLPVKGRLPT